MKILFLGTGAAEGIPAIFCDCAVCVEAGRRGGPNLRTRSTVLIDDSIKIDLPPDTLAHVHAYGTMCLAQLQHLVFTHSHDDHFAVRELQYLSPNFAPGRKGSLDVWATNEVTRKMLPEMEHFFEKAPLRFHPVSPFETFAVGHLHFTPITAHHKRDELCLNYLVTDPATETTILYASDTGWYDTPTWTFLANRRISGAIIECGKGASDNTYEGHLNITEASHFRQKLVDDGAMPADAPVYLTHISHTGLLLHEEMNEVVAQLGMQVAHDGLEITF